MSRKQEFLCMLEGERADGSKEIFLVHTQGGSIIIQGPGHPHIMHPSAKTPEQEIRIVYDVKIKRRSVDGRNWLDVP